MNQRRYFGRGLFVLPRKTDDGNKAFVEEGLDSSAILRVDLVKEAGIRHAERGQRRVLPPPGTHDPAYISRELIAVIGEGIDVGEHLGRAGDFQDGFEADALVADLFAGALRGVVKPAQGPHVGLRKRLPEISDQQRPRRELQANSSIQLTGGDARVDECIVGILQQLKQKAS